LKSRAWALFFEKTKPALPQSVSRYPRKDLASLSKAVRKLSWHLSKIGDKNPLGLK
jgi:hypothetical protein